MDVHFINDKTNQKVDISLKKIADSEDQENPFHYPEVV